MLIRFALDADGVAELGTHDEDRIRSTQRLLSPLLAHVGILVLANPSDRARLASAVHGLPQELRKIWTTLLEDVARIDAAEPRPIPLNELTARDDLSSWHQQIRLGLVGSDAGARAGLTLGNGRLLHKASDIELSRLLTAESKRLEEAQALLERDVQRGEHRDDVWRTRFQAAASTGFPITIFDSYATQHLHRAGGCGLVWFLKQVADAGTAPVHIISCANSSQAARAVADDLKQLEPQLSGVTSATLTLASRKTYRRFAHARHVRFRAFVMCLDRGLSMFDYPCCRYSMPCPRISAATAREREEDIERNALNGFRRFVLW